MSRGLRLGPLLLLAGLPASPADAAARLLRDHNGAIIGASGLGAACSTAGDDGPCVDFVRTGTVVEVVRNRHRLVTGLSVRMHGFYSQRRHVFRFDLAFGDGVMELTKPLPARVARPLARWLRPKRRLRLTGTINGADGGLMILTGFCRIGPGASRRT